VIRENRENGVEAKLKNYYVKRARCAGKHVLFSIPHALFTSLNGMGRIKVVKENGRKKNTGELLLNIKKPEKRYQNKLWADIVLDRYHKLPPVLIKFSQWWTRFCQQAENA